MRPNRMKSTLLATGIWVVLMSAGALHPSLRAQSAPRDTMISACVHVINGSMRLVLPSEACKREETKIQWSMLGGGTGPAKAATSTWPCSTRR